MRFIKVPEVGLMAAGEHKRPKTKIKLSWEDAIIALILIIIITGLITKELSIAEALTYLGVTGSGGVWGFVSGNRSSKS